MDSLTFLSKFIQLNYLISPSELILIVPALTRILLMDV